MLLRHTTTCLPRGLGKPLFTHTRPRAGLVWAGCRPAAARRGGRGRRGPLRCSCWRRRRRVGAPRSLSPELLQCVAPAHPVRVVLRVPADTAHTHRHQHRQQSTQRASYRRHQSAIHPAPNRVLVSGVVQVPACPRLVWSHRSPRAGPFVADAARSCRCCCCCCSPLGCVVGVHHAPPAPWPLRAAPSSRPCLLRLLPSLGLLPSPGVTSLVCCPCSAPRSVWPWQEDPRPSPSALRRRACTPHPAVRRVSSSSAPDAHAAHVAHMLGRFVRGLTGLARGAAVAAAAAPAACASSDASFVAAIQIQRDISYAPP